MYAFARRAISNNIQNLLTNSIHEVIKTVESRMHSKDSDPFAKQEILINVKRSAITTKYTLLDYLKGVLVYTNYNWFTPTYIVL